MLSDGGGDASETAQEKACREGGEVGVGDDARRKVRRVRREANCRGLRAVKTAGLEEGRSRMSPIE